MVHSHSAKTDGNVMMGRNRFIAPRATKMRSERAGPGQGPTRTCQSPGRRRPTLAVLCDNTMLLLCCAVLCCYGYASHLLDSSLRKLFPPCCMQSPSQSIPSRVRASQGLPKPVLLFSRCAQGLAMWCQRQPHCPLLLATQGLRLEAGSPAW